MEVIHMKKSTITKTWIGGLVVFAAGILVAIVGVGLMLAYGGTFTQVADTNQYDFTPALNGFFWSTVWLTVLGGVVTAIGGVVQLASWIGGLFNSYLLPSKAWFAILIVTGVFSFAFAPIGFAGMLAYVVGAPDGEPYAKAQAPAMQPQMPLAPTA
jgi:hypothetical protein